MCAGHIIYTFLLKVLLDLLNQQSNPREVKLGHISRFGSCILVRAHGHLPDPVIHRVAEKTDFRS